MKSKLASIKAESRLLTKEVPSLEDLLRKKVIEADIVGRLEVQQRKPANARYWRTKAKKGKDEDPLKRWLGWEYHCLLKRVVRDLKMNLIRVLSRRKAKQANNNAKVQELLAKPGREFSDDDLSDVVEDVTDDDDFDSEDDLER